MKLFNSILFTLFALITIVLAQDVQIGFPPAGTRVKPGEHLIVEIDQPNSIQGSVNVGVAIGINSCGYRHPTCLPASDGLFDVLFAGPYVPKFHSPMKPRYENFTVVIPSLPRGPAQLNVAYAGLFGAASFPFFQTLNQTLFVV